MLCVDVLAEPALRQRNHLGQRRRGGNEQPANPVAVDNLVPIGLRVQQGLIVLQRALVETPVLASTMIGCCGSCHST